MIFLGRFIFLKFCFIYFGAFNKRINPFDLVGYEMIIANSWLCTIPTRACGITVKYMKYHIFELRT